MTPSRLVILLLIVLAVLQYTYYEPLLPDRIASHFDVAGQADGWSSKSAFLLSNLALIAGLALIFLSFPSWLGKIPNARINLPNKDYWLAPGRRAATLQTIQRQMEWLGAATLVLFLGVAQLSIEANLTGRPTLGPAPWVLSGCYLLAMTVWLVRFIRWAYARPPREDGAQADA